MSEIYQAINTTKAGALAETWTVVHIPTNEYLSHHETAWQALQAIQRYREADARREPRPYTVTVRYRTNSGCNAKDVTVSAISSEQALQLASDKVKRMRGVIRIDGGEWRA